MFKRGVARKLTHDESQNYVGPVDYIAHHAVVKPESESTPVRIVFDSSHKYRGHSLNDYWAKGPDNYMNNMLSVLLKFRENRVGFVGDLKKMYNSILMKERDQHVHRFLWRGMDSSRSPDINVITAVNIGDRPSGTIAAVALQKTATMANQSHPLASRTVLKSTYVDDIVDSVDSVEMAVKLCEDISTILQPGNFHVKTGLSRVNPKTLKLSATNPTARRSLAYFGIRNRT